MKTTKHTAAFVNTLHDRINAYFKTNQLTIKSDSMMVSKIVIGLSWWICSYIALFIFPLTEMQFICLYLFHGVGHIYFSFNVGHDALHNAVSRSKSVNRFWAYSYDLLGVNTYMWRIMHHRGHHACLNVQGEDMSLETAGIFRLSTGEKRKWYHKYQHIYSFFIYGSYLFYYVFVKDYKYFFSKTNRHVKDLNHPIGEYIKLFLGKAIYLLYMLIIPLYILPYSNELIIATFCITLFMIGLVMSFTFQTTHIVDSTHYPSSRTEYENYVYHVFETTADYCARNPLANWFFGGLNVHVIHHLRSDICHTHYPALTVIVRDTAKEFGVPYRENNSIWAAGMAHLRQLKKLGNSD
jgi:linoleoyl-CoA desaturase